MEPTTAPGIRARNRADLTAAILNTAREHLATRGSAGLSLRAVARDLDMASSAVYRYVPSREALLTQLIMAAYESLGDAVEAAERAIPRRDHAGRFRAVGQATRAWALGHEHEYALIYGTPVPGYHAPQDTIAPATRVTTLLIALVVESVQAGKRPQGAPITPSLARAIEPAQAAFDAAGTPIPPELVIRGLMSWATIQGTVSLELFGQFHNVVTTERQQANPFFDAVLDRLIETLDL